MSKASKTTYQYGLGIKTTETDIKCNMCDQFFMEPLGSKHDKLNLQLFEDGEELYKGCCNCKTDGYLMDV